MAPADFSPIDPRTVTPRRLGMYRRNVETLISNANPEQRDYGRTWYPRAHDIAEKVGRGDVRTGAGIVAALSPSTEWGANVNQAHELTRSFPDKHLAALRGAHEHLEGLKRLQTEHRRAHGFNNPTIAADIDKATESHNRVRAETVGKTRALRLQATPNILKAADIRDGKNPEQALPMQIKTGNFYKNMVDPSDPHPVTVDVHMHDAVIGRGDLEHKVPRGLSSVGRYNLFADVVRQAADRTGMPTANQAQGTAWVVHKATKKSRNSKTMPYDDLKW
ncbi:hypothetical protein [Microbispora sp. NPDC049633]|uniref:DUF7178 family protein n=1 Tax=Microbispora sp. NPDC049633 TaxID=3154355 RepID=UPI00342B1097